jgi:hypothetical protein
MENQLVLREPTAQHKARSHQPGDRLLKVGGLGADRGFRCAFYKADCHRIIQDLGRVIKELMCSAKDCSSNGRSTGLSLVHGYASASGCEPSP